MSKSGFFALFILGEALVLAVCLLHAALDRRDALPITRLERRQVESLELTDLALFAEARYTRHPTMADLHAPFQDHPGALEHFPSGSLIGPPAQLTK